MFWKKEKFKGNNVPFFIDQKGTYRRLVTEEEWDKMKEKLNLILDHLNLEYVPETEKKEPAKLVEKEKVIECDVHPAIHGFFTDFPDSTLWNKTAPKKKKRGRPKKK